MGTPANLREWLTVLEKRHPVSIDMGLERVAQVWSRLGQPRPARRLITVGGTNGKGSVVAYLTAMLNALRYRCGTYTSPHLHRYNERVEILGKMVTDEALVAAFEQIEQGLGDTSLTYFEFGTLAAFLLMSEANLDFAVLEVGLGGRLDAVNMLDTDCAVITSIGLDHLEYLGPDRESVGREKAGIIRPGKPFICGDPDPPQSLLAAASGRAHPILRFGHEYGIGHTAKGDHAWLGDRNLALPPSRMAGRHQIANMATALAALGTLLPDALEQSVLLREALGSVRLPGRLQAWREGSGIWLDVGHNEHAAEAVAAALQAMHTRFRYAVLGMLADKDAAAVGRILDPYVQTWYCAGLAGERGQTGEELAARLAGICGAGRVRSFGNVAGALQAARADCGADESILVFGSFLTVAQAAAFLSGNC